MSEWWTEWSTYRPADFLMFSPRIYARLFESINAAWWPAAVLLGTALFGALLAARLLSRSPARATALRIALAALAAACALTAWQFLQLRFAPIFWPAALLAAALALQTIGLALLALLATPALRERGVARTVGTLLIALGLLYPVFTLADGRGSAQVEAFALAPDPTLIATLGLLLRLRWAGGAPRRLRIALLPVPLLALLFSATLLATMGWWLALLPLLAVVATFVALLAGRTRPRAT